MLWFSSSAVPAAGFRIATDSWAVSACETSLLGLGRRRKRGADRSVLDQPGA
jgi:hypothetical protein